HDVVDRAAVLVEVELGVAGVVVVEELDLHADAADVALFGGAEVDAAVAAGRQAVLQPQLEVGVVALGAQPAAAPAAADEHAVLGRPHARLAGVLLPAGQVLAAEERDEAVRLFPARQLLPGAGKAGGEGGEEDGEAAHGKSSGGGWRGPLLLTTPRGAAG